MNNIKWELWVPYLEKPGVLMGFVALLVALITFSLITKHQKHVKLVRTVVFTFLAIAIFVVSVAAYKNIQEPSPGPHASSVQDKPQPQAKPIVAPDKSPSQYTNIQIVNGSHNSTTNQNGKAK